MFFISEQSRPTLILQMQHICMDVLGLTFLSKQCKRRSECNIWSVSALVATAPVGRIISAGSNMDLFYMICNIYNNPV